MEKGRAVPVSDFTKRLKIANYVKFLRLFGALIVPHFCFYSLDSARSVARRTNGWSENADIPVLVTTP